MILGISRRCLRATEEKWCFRVVGLKRTVSNYLENRFRKLSKISRINNLNRLIKTLDSRKLTPIK